MSTSISEAPHTYHQWLSCLECLRAGREERAILQLLAEGTMPHMNERVTDAFVQHVDETVRTMMQRRTDRLLDRLDRLLEERDWDGAELLVRRFRADVQACFFFEALPFLPQQALHTLSAGYRAQLRDFWLRLADSLADDAQHTASVALEDLTYSVRRMSGHRKREQVEV